MEADRCDEGRRWLGRKSSGNGGAGGLRVLFRLLISCGFLYGYVWICLKNIQTEEIEMT